MVEAGYGCPTVQVTAIRGSEIGQFECPVCVHGQITLEGSSRNLEAGEHCIRERRFPPMVILGSTALQRKALNRRIPMTKIKKCSRSRQKKRPTRSRKPTYSPVFLRQWKKLSTIII